MIFADTFPKALPITNVGIKIPPTPPAANVVVMAMALNSVISNKKPITIQTFSKSTLYGMSFKAAKAFPSNKLLINP